MLELFFLGLYGWLFKKFALGGSWADRTKGSPNYESKEFSELSRISPKDFEYHCASWLRHKGYQVQISRNGGGDNNIDIYVSDSLGNLIGIAECKHWKKQVGAAPLKVLYATMLNVGVKKSWFFSLNGFSQKALEYAKNDIGEFQIELMEGKKI